MTRARRLAQRACIPTFCYLSKICLLQHASDDGLIMMEDVAQHLHRFGSLRDSNRLPAENVQNTTKTVTLFRHRPNYEVTNIYSLMDVDGQVADCF